MPTGPALPPHLAHLAENSCSPSPPLTVSSNQQPVDEEDEDDYGPALPPHLAAGPSRPSVPAGPQIPFHVQGPPAYSQPVLEDEDSDDDIIGPRPIASVLVEERSAVQEFMEREARWASEREVSPTFL